MPKIKITTKAKARAQAQAKARALQARRRKQWIFVGFLGLALIILLVVLLNRPGEAVDAANSFLALLGEEKISEAYQATSRAFQERVNEADFKTQVDGMGLMQYDSVAWAKEMRTGDHAELEGTVATKPGDKFPVKMTLVLVQRQWKVFSLSGTPAGIGTTPPDQTEPPAPTSPAPPPVTSPGQASVPIPGESELKNLVYETVSNLQQAVGKKDFSAFYGFISAQWQKEISAAELKKQYQPLIDKKFERTPLININPVLEREPYIGLDDSMTLIGYYPTKPLKVAFELKYAREDALWKLLSAEIKLSADADYTPGLLPGTVELNRLVTSTLLTLNDSIATKNFVPLHQSLAKARQQQTTPEKLQAEFQDAIDKKLDMQAISDVDPEFTDRPFVNMDNQFTTNGSFKAKDLQLGFRITYQFEDARWKPLAIKIEAEISKAENAGEKSQ